MVIRVSAGDHGGCVVTLSDGVLTSLFQGRASGVPPAGPEPPHLLPCRAPSCRRSRRRFVIELPTAQPPGMHLANPSAERGRQGRQLAVVARDAELGDGLPPRTPRRDDQATAADDAAARRDSQRDDIEIGGHQVWIALLPLCNPVGIKLSQETTLLSLAFVRDE